MPTQSCVGRRSSTVTSYNGVPGCSLMPRSDTCSSGPQSDLDEAKDAELCTEEREQAGREDFETC